MTIFLLISAQFQRNATLREGRIEKSYFIHFTFSPFDQIISLTSKMRFANNRLTSLHADNSLLGSTRLCRVQLKYYSKTSLM